MPNSQCSSNSTIAEPTGLNPWQRRWNMEWLSEAYIPYMHHSDLLMERSSNRNKYHINYRECQETRPGTEKFMANAIEAGIASPSSTLTRTRWPCGARSLTWPVRMLASDTKRLWRRWRKHRADAKRCQMVVVMEEHGETPRWRGEMKLTFESDFLFDNWIPSDPKGFCVDFPSARDIKWYTMRSSLGKEWLQGGQDTWGWGPYPTALSCIPFVVVDGSVVRTCRPDEVHERADGNVFDNFVLSCPHCGQRS